MEKLNQMEAAKLAIEKTKEYFTELGLPLHLKDIGIEEKMLPVMAHAAAIKGVGYFENAFRPLDEQSALEIYKMAF